MKIRKNITSLTPQEKKDFVEALLKLKKDGRYDEYVHWPALRMCALRTMIKHTCQNFF